jgi:DNA-binding transcriptional LysR family regulator
MADIKNWRDGVRVVRGQSLDAIIRVNRALQLTPVGQELYRITDATLAQLDAVVDRIAGAAESVAVTTTSGLASLWLAPRLPRFNRAHPGIDVRVVASNDEPDLTRDQLDLAI